MKLSIESSQSSLLEGENKPKSDHEGIEYSVDLSGNVAVKDKEVDTDEGIAVSNADDQEYRKFFCDRVERVVKRLPPMERFLIESVI